MELTFEITEQVRGGVPVVAVVGEIDVATAPTLAEHLAAHEEAGASLVVVDLLGVSFLDSTALGVLVGSFKRLGESGGTLRLVIAEPRILKVFEITDLVRVFPITSTVEEALPG
ncbi:MAG TPA: STAS domain-containing protein [Acidimicrobiales bacterium]|jgi:anti-sigma B factor antagonist|nr:STAS domain-containing protein [Acidimicrobiales bacterium]